MRNIRELYQDFPIFGATVDSNKTLEYYVDFYKPQGLNKIVYQAKWGGWLHVPKYAHYHKHAFKLIFDDPSKNTIIAYVEDTTWVNSQSKVSRAYFNTFCKGGQCNNYYNIDTPVGGVHNDVLEELSFSDEVIVENPDITPPTPLEYSIIVADLKESKLKDVSDALNALAVNFKVELELD